MDLSYNGMVADFWKCPNCKREIGVKRTCKSNEDEFI